MGGLYNVMYGFNPACIFLMPMLGRTKQEYPRFRDCHYEDGLIAIVTRVGGNNRNQGYGEDKLYEDPNFVRTYDDCDNTYGTYLFRVPEKWRDDFDKVVNKKFPETSAEYKAMIYQWWPSLADSGFLDNVFYGDRNDIKGSL